MSLSENDRDEWRSARDHAYRTGADMTHPANCRCNVCITEEVWASEAADPDNRSNR